MMSKQDILDKLVEDGNGYLQTATVLESGVSKQTLAKYVQSHGMKRIAQGVYAAEDAWPDGYYLLSLRNRRIVFSHESALYLHDLTHLLAVIMVVFLLLFRIVVVSGSSMYNTLWDGDWLLVISNVFYGEPEYGDIIVASKDSLLACPHFWEQVLQLWVHSAIFDLSP